MNPVARSSVFSTGMRVRRLLTIGSVAGLVLTAPSSAEAKGEGHVRVDGPGLAGAIVLRDPGEVASLFWGAGLGEMDRVDRPGPSATWGPRYELRFSLSGGDGEPRSSVVQFLYPFADGGRFGMWSFTPSGQHWSGGQRVVGGWWLVSVDAERVLHAHGFPSSAGREVSSNTTTSRFRLA